MRQCRLDRRFWGLVKTQNKAKIRLLSQNLL